MPKLHHYVTRVILTVTAVLVYCFLQPSYGYKLYSYLPFANLIDAELLLMLYVGISASVVSAIS